MKPKIFNIYKPKGPTSAQIIGRLKRSMDEKAKIGHFGTLDPFASGILLVGVSGALRINQYFSSNVSKTYRCLGLLGKKTDTADCMGEVIETAKIPILPAPKILEEMLIKKFVGEYFQSPPAFSAAKHKGKALYKYAREGIFIQKEAKRREIYSLRVLKVSSNELELEVEVSSGTYIRTLFEDMAAFLGTLGHLVELERTAIGPFKSTNSIDADTFPVKEKWGEFFEKGNTPDECLELPALDLGLEEGRKYTNGVSLSTSSTEGMYWVYDSNKTLLGLGEINSEGILRPKVNYL